MSLFQSPQDHYGRHGRQVIPAPDGVPTLAGVVSWGVGCGKTSPGAGVYTDIRGGMWNTYLSADNFFHLTDHPVISCFTFHEKKVSFHPQEVQEMDTGNRRWGAGAPLDCLIATLTMVKIVHNNSRFKMRLNI